MFLVALIVSIITTFVKCQVSINDFYPFGENEGDRFLARCDDDSSGIDGIPLGRHGFPFFGQIRHKIWVNTNGHLTTDSPMTDWNTRQFGIKHNPYQMIAPFWADIDISLYGSILYRSTTDAIILNRVSNEAKTYFEDLGTMDFHANFAFIATWRQVPRYPCGGNGNCTKLGNSCAPERNTFQCILATDGSNSIALYFYEQITWTKAIVADQDIYPEVGFDAGDKKHYYEVRGSLDPAIASINTRSNVRIPGKWAFRINAVNVVPPSTTASPNTCNVPTTQENATPCTPCTCTCKCPDNTNTQHNYPNKLKQFWDPWK